MSDWEKIIKEIQPLKKKAVSFSSQKLKLKNPKESSVKTNWTPKEPKVYPRLDLHGFTEEGAFERIKAFFEANKGQEVRVITGKSGILRQNFPRWCELGVLSKYCKYIKLEETGGSFLVKL